LGPNWAHSGPFNHWKDLAQKMGTVREASRLFDPLKLKFPNCRRSSSVWIRDARSHSRTGLQMFVAHNSFIIKRCADMSSGISSLSGTTWRGAKLRLAPAKPDYAARIAKENEAASAAAVAATDDTPPKKRKRVHGTQGHETSDMNVVTVDNYESRKVRLIL